MKKLKLIFLVVIAFQSNAQIITTVAGNGSTGYTGDGVQATATALNTPYGVGMDSVGNLFIGDYGNQRIRKVSVTGVISTVAGTGVAGFNGDGLLATATQLNGPYGMSVDRLGTIYIADRSNHRVRSIQTEVGGVVITIAGTGVAGFSGDGGPAVSAQINHPQGPFRDNSGNVYFCDADNQRVRKIDGSGIITTIAGNGTAGYSGDGGAATAAMLNQPSGVTKDSAGNIYIAEYLNHTIRRVSPAGIITTICGSGASGYGGDGGPAGSALLSYPKDVYADRNGNILITDSGNQRLRKIDAAGVIKTIAGTGVIGFTGDGGPATSARLNWHQGVFVDSADDIYIGDCLNQRVRKISCAPPVVSAITGADTICVGSTATLTCLTAGGTWLSTNARATITASGVVAGVAVGLDTIKYVVSNSCTSVPVSHIIYISPCATTHISNVSGEGLKIYPNPANDKLTVTATEVINNITISNSVGQTVYSREYNTLQAYIDISGLPQGVYQIKVNGLATRRFVKL